MGWGRLEPNGSNRCATVTRRCSASVPTSRWAMPWGSSPPGWVAELEALPGRALDPLVSFRPWRLIDPAGARADELIALLAQRATYLTPTLTLSQSILRGNSPEGTDPAGLDGMPAPVREQWSQYAYPFDYSTRTGAGRRPPGRHRQHVPHLAGHEERRGGGGLVVCRSIDAAVSASRRRRLARTQDEGAPSAVRRGRGRRPAASRAGETAQLFGRQATRPFSTRTATPSSSCVSESRSRTARAARRSGSR